ncbi:PREDICTED: MARCKS-related protein [Nanorana parkeri]|uniref:MARCKS-related protein n=1 Tax=Nanorana parkeri TaxID=125878 RepID=UPI00085418D9|nr:PREDICTED: MARCKS-related protein [Nanorana parkeri]
MHNAAHNPSRVLCEHEVTPIRMLRSYIIPVQPIKPKEDQEKMEALATEENADIAVMEGNTCNQTELRLEGFFFPLSSFGYILTNFFVNHGQHRVQEPERRNRYSEQSSRAGKRAREDQGETIEQAPPANGDSKPEEPPGKQGKKKKFSFKKPFKLPFRKNKKEAVAAAAEESPAAEEEAAADSPKEESAAKAEEPQTENVAEPASAPEAASTTPEEAPAAEPEPAAAPAEQSEASPSTEPAVEPPKEE